MDTTMTENHLHTEASRVVAELRDKHPKMPPDVRNNRAVLILKGKVPPRYHPVLLQLVGVMDDSMDNLEKWCRRQDRAAKAAESQDTRPEGPFNSGAGYGGEQM